MSLTVLFDFAPYFSQEYPNSETILGFLAKKVILITIWLIHVKSGNT